MIQEKIKQYITYKGITKYRFYKETGLSNGFLDKKGTIGVDKCEIISYRYPDLNLEWLITGKGDMLKSNQYKDSDNENYAVEPIKDYCRTKDTIKDIQEIPLYNLQATSGLVELFKGSHQDAVIDNIKIPGIASCDGAVYVSGDSMCPLLKSGDIVLYKKVDISRLFWGEMYLLSIKVTDWEEYITVKFVQKSELGKEYVKIASQNPHHQSKDVLLSDISAIALIRASIRIQTS